MPSRFSLQLRAVALLTAVGALTFGLALPAGAAPSGTAAPGTRDLNVLNEQYNLTRMRLDEATAALVATQGRLQATKEQAAAVEDLVRARSARLYEGAAGGGVAAVLNVGTVNELSRRTQYVSAASKPDRALMRTLSRTLRTLDARERSTSDARDRLRAEAETMAAARKKLMAEAAAAAAQSRPAADGAGPVGTPRAMLVASSVSSATARTSLAPASMPDPGSVPTPTAPRQPPTTRPPASPPTSTPPPSNPTPPAPSSRAAAAIAYARAQLGKPYAFATSGPNTFDCSGLTMAAWQAAGVRMAHYSGAQAASFPKVSWSQLLPGDIVVFYSDYHHVGLYIGGGTMIHAPQTGDVVKIAPAWRENFQFGVRPG